MQEIFALIERMEKSNLTNFKLEQGGTTLELSREQGATVVSAAPMVATQSMPVAPANSPAEQVSAQPATKGTAVKAPLAGTFYAAASVDAQPFVKVGDTVQKGAPLCILEAMKTMNELPSPVSGTVSEILVQNGDIIGFDDVLFYIVE